MTWSGTPVDLTDAIPLVAADGHTGRNKDRDIRYGLIGAVFAGSTGTDTFRTGVVPRFYDTAVSQWADMRVVQKLTASRTVTVQTGKALLTRSGQGPYLAWNEAGADIIADPADGTNPRIDSVFAINYDQVAFVSDPSHGPKFIIVNGTPAGSPVAPATPTDAERLCDMLRPAGVDAIDQAKITDKRRSAQLVGGQLIYLAGDTVTAAGRYPNDWRIHPTTGKLEIWSGSAWGEYQGTLLPRGVIARASRSTNGTGTGNTSQATGQKLCELTATVKAGRLYRINAPNLQPFATLATTVEFALTYTTDGTAPTVTSAKITSTDAQVVAGGTPGFAALQALYAPSSDQTLRVLISYFCAGSATTVATFGSATRPVEFFIEDVALDPGVTGTQF